MAGPSRRKVIILSKKSLARLIDQVKLSVKKKGLYTISIFIQCSMAYLVTFSFLMESYTVNGGFSGEECKV